jgi:hypothetical protein
VEIKGNYVILTKEEFAGLLAVIEQLKKGNYSPSNIDIQQCLV